MRYLAGAHGMNPSLKIGHLLLAFVLAALPFAATFLLYYPDERHYTDGALMMLKSGDWLVPHTAAGALRFQKPILAYWAVAASWLVFGVNVLAARLPFLLAGCGTLWLTHRLARKLTGDGRLALLAAIVLAAHPQFFLCSVRSMPDALQVFFVTLSAFGFLRLMAFEELTPGAFWMAYGGAAGAAMSKGLLGAGIVVFAWAFAFGRRRDWQAVKKLIHLPSLVTSAAFVVAGTGLVLWEHGETAFTMFFGDQVTGNLQGRWWEPFWRAPVFAGALVLNFLPWSMTVIESLARKRSIAAPGVPAVGQKFILAWTVLLVAGFALGVNVSLRYLLPAAPLMAVLVAAWMQNAGTAKLIFSAERMFTMLLVLLLALTALALVTGFAWRLPFFTPVLAGAGFAMGILWLGWAVLRKKNFPAAEALGVAMLLGSLIFFTAIMPVLLPDRAQQIAAALHGESENPAAPVLLVGDIKLASRVRVLLGKDWAVTHTDHLTLANATNYTRVVISEKNAGEFATRGWKIQTAALSFGLPPHAELWAALKSGGLYAALARHGQTMVLATPE